MGEPAVDIKDGLKEAMEEVSRQIEDLKEPSEEEKGVQSDETSLNEEVPLNVEEEITADVEESNEEKIEEGEINLNNGNEKDTAKDQEEEGEVLKEKGQDDVTLSQDKEVDKKETKEEEIPLDVDSLDEDELFDDDDIFLEKEESTSSIEKEDQEETLEENRETTDANVATVKEDALLLEKQEEKISEDEVGIDVSDDELWEDDAEEVSLFEEDVLNELSAEEEKKQEKKSEAEKISLLDEEGKKDSDNKQEDVEENTKETIEEPIEKKGFFVFLPWVVTGISTVLSIFAIFTLWTLLQTPVPNAKSATSGAAQQNKAVPLKTSSKNGSGVPKVVSDLQAIDLAPFIIPGKSGGELVFFKLRVELLVPNARTKQEILKRQAWVRDIIYQELKGIDISSGIKGDVLQRFRMPILNKLNKELSPIKVSDVRLMGYLLR